MKLSDEQKDRLSTVMTFLREHPDRWNQEVWGVNRVRPAVTAKERDAERDLNDSFSTASCGTTACVAGWTSLIFDADNVTWKPVHNPHVLYSDKAPVTWITELDPRRIKTDAAELLGIEEEPDFLFDWSLSWDELERRAKALIEDRVVITDEGYLDIIDEPAEV